MLKQSVKLKEQYINKSMIFLILLKFLINLMKSGVKVC